MPKEYQRTQRVGDLIQRQLSILIQREVKDPRLKFLTISAVEVTRDLSWAKVYVSALGTEEEIQEIVAVLNKAAGFLRHALSQTLTFRITPQLNFVYDASLSRGKKLADIIDNAIASDKRHPSEDEE